MRDLAPSEVYEYAAEDADITLRLKNVLEPKLKEIDCEDLFWNVEMPLGTCSCPHGDDWRMYRHQIH